MECKKCGAINPDEAVFCAQCGTRLDGKAPCPSCGKLNDETNAYCNFCGTRLDGKTVCKTCGAVFEGNFCPKCGAGARAAETAATHAAAAPKAAAKALPGKTAKRVIRLVQSSLVFSAIFCMLVFSLCLGFTQTLKSGGETVPVETENVYYFLFSVWKDIRMVFDALSSASPDVEVLIYFEAYFSLYMPYILIAVALGANIVVCLTYGILAVVKFSTGIGRTDVPLAKYLVPPVVSTLAAVTVPLALMGATEATGDTSAHISFGLNGAGVAEIVLVAVFLAGAIVLECLLNGKAVANRLKKIVPFAIGALLLAVAAGVLSANFFTLGAGQTAAKTSLVSMLSGFLFMIGIISGELPANLSQLSTLSVVEYFTFALLAASILITIYFLLREMFSDEKSSGETLLFGIFSAAFAVMFLVVAVLIKNKLLDIGVENGTEILAKLGAMPVAVLVLSLLALAAVIVGFALGRAQRAPEKPQDDTPDNAD